MAAALLVRFRPPGPWRFGPDDGAKDRTDLMLHSDALFSALTIAMRDLGWLQQWVQAMAESADPSVRLSSCYPYSGRTLLIQPPRSVWPVPQAGTVRWKSARFVPISLIASLLREEALQDGQWAVDPESQCLLPVTKRGPLSPPFKVVRRSNAAVDRISGSSESAQPVGCLQFGPGAGMWFAAAFISDAARAEWSPRLRSAVRLLADTGLGGGRSRGFGRSDEPEFEEMELESMLTGGLASEGGESAWWLLSLFSPDEQDSIDWKRGNYSVCVRAGRIDSPASCGDIKPAMRTIAEGSVLLSGSPLAGTVRNVAGAEIPHPVYRSGIALAVQIPWKETHRLSRMMEATEPAPEAPPRQEPPVEPVPPEEEPPVEQPPAEEPPAEPESTPAPVEEPEPTDTTEAQPS